MNTNTDLSVILLHQDMVDKHDKLVTTSLTLNDVQDLSRSCRTFGVKNLYIAHPSPSIRKLGLRLQTHWLEGFGSTYNKKRKEAMSFVEIVDSLDEAIMKIDLRTGKLPKLIATSAKEGKKRVSFSELRDDLDKEPNPHLLMLGTGWGMSDELLNRADLFLEPIRGVSTFNHLSVRSACAIMLARLHQKT